MTRDGERVFLWDWEHYEEGVPIGFDALHFRGQQLRNADRKHLDRGEDVWWAERRSLLARLDVLGVAADLTTVLYLVRQRAFRHRRPVGPGRVAAPGRLGPPAARAHGRPALNDRRR
jgi:hypothetical protein